MSGIVDQLLNGVVKGALAEVLTKTGIRKTRRARRTKSAGSLAGGIVGSVLEAAINAAVKPKPAKKQVSKDALPPPAAGRGIAEASQATFLACRALQHGRIFTHHGWKSRRDMLSRNKRKAAALNRM